MIISKIANIVTTAQHMSVYKNEPTHMMQVFNQWYQRPHEKPTVMTEMRYIMILISNVHLTRKGDQ